MDYAEISRDAMAETLLAAGPTASTLCEGWESRHLAAHLVLREHSGWAAGLFIKPLSHGMRTHLDRMAAEAEDPASYARLIVRFRMGPGRLSPLRVPSVDAAANILEYFVHTEDVRRARTDWSPRFLHPGYDQRLWKLLIQRAGMLYRGAGVGVILVRPDGRRKVVRRGDDAVAVHGGVGELVMHAFGRPEAALITYEGSENAVARLRAHRAGI